MDRMVESRHRKGVGLEFEEERKDEGPLLEFG